MKVVMTALLTLFSFASIAQDITLPGEDYVMNDIASLGIAKEEVFKGMDRKFIKLGGSICANRAHMWSYDFKRDHNIDGGKLFLFYTKKTGEGTLKNWWYHVTPVINEKGQIFAMDAGFSGIKKPLTPKEWLHYFTGSYNCREIQDTDTDLINRMFKGAAFPETTAVGTYDCYYRIVPAGYWFPSSVAKHLLGTDSSGRPVRFERPEIRKEEVYSACVEAVTSSIGRFLGGGKKKCREYVEN
jgi:hypothetical protein